MSAETTNYTYGSSTMGPTEARASSGVIKQCESRRQLHILILDECEKEFDTDALLKIHVYSVHLGRKYCCLVCSKPFESEKIFKEHAVNCYLEEKAKLKLSKIIVSCPPRLARWTSIGPGSVGVCSRWLIFKGFWTKLKTKAEHDIVGED